MSESNDEQRLRATEAQMRRALGLGNSTPARGQVANPIASSNAHTHRRQFIRDGEVPVTVIHHDDSNGTKKLEAARKALSEQIVARERIERQLEEARSAIQALETQLEHGRIAKDEALQRAEDRRQEVERQLEDERATRKQAVQERDEAIARGREAEERLGEVMATQGALNPSAGPERVKRSGKGVWLCSDRASDVTGSAYAVDGGWTAI